MKAINAILEVEIGVVGGEEDGVSHDINEHLYTTLDDAIATVEALGLGEQGRYMAALTFGNVHGVYAPGNVKLKPELLKEIQDGLAAKYGTGPKPLDLVFHGGSGSTDAEIAAAVANGVVKMNIDTDTQYAFTRSIAGYMFSNYDGVLKVDGERRQQEAVRPARLGQGRRVGHGRARRRVDPPARLRRRSRSAPRSRMPDSTPRGPRRPADRPATGGSAASPAPATSARARSTASTRPRGGPGSRRPARPRPIRLRRWPRRRARVRREPVRGIRRPQLRPERPADRAVTILLLVIGVLGVWLAIGVLQALPDSMQLLHTPEGIDALHAGPRDPGLILTGSIVQVVIWVATARRLDRAHARPTALVLAADRWRRHRRDRAGRLHAVALSGDPALIDAHDDRRLTGPRHRRRALRIARRRTAAGRASPPDVSRAG